MKTKLHNLFIFIITIFIALIPESIMYLTYNLISPSSDIAKVLLLGIFWFGGVGLCFLFAYLAFVFFVVKLKN